MRKLSKILIITLILSLIIGIMLKWNSIEDYYVLSKRFEKPKDRDGAWEQDLNYLKNDFLKVCRSFDTETSKKFNSEIDYILNNISSFTDNQIMVKLIHAVALTNDAHTNLKFKLLPRVGIVVSWFKEGLFITYSSSSNINHLGKRIIKINGLSIDKITQDFDEYIPGNIYNKRLSLTSLIIRPDLWNGMSKTYSPDYLIVDMEDSTGLVQIDTINIEKISSSLINLYWENIPDSFFVKHCKSFDSLPLYLSSPNKAAYYQNLKYKSIYIQVNSSTNKGINLTEFADDLKIQLDSNSYENIVYDIRLNGGGNYNLTRKIENYILKELAENEGHLYLITGNQTASAAINSASSLKYHLKNNISIIGEPIGDNLIFWAEPKIFRLPNSRIQISASIYQHDLKDDRFIPFKTNWGNLFWNFASNGLDVTLPVEISINDYIAYKDPVMEKINELIEKKQ